MKLNKRISLFIVIYFSIYFGALYHIIVEVGENTFAYSNILVNIDEVIHIDEVGNNKGRMLAIRYSEDKAIIMLSTTTYDMICGNGNTCTPTPALTSIP